MLSLQRGAAEGVPLGAMVEHVHWEPEAMLTSHSALARISKYKAMVANWIIAPGEGKPCSISALRGRV